MRKFNNYIPCQNGFQQMQEIPQQQNFIQPQQYQQIPQQGTSLSTMPAIQSCTQSAPSSMTMPAQLPAVQAPTSAAIPSATSITSSNFGSIMDIAYTQGYLKTQIGRRVKIEFLLGTNMLVDRDGVLLSVGASYLTIREAETDDVLLCDLYSIKFVRFYF